jgi:hypothetical protein
MMRIFSSPNTIYEIANGIFAEVNLIAVSRMNRQEESPSRSFVPNEIIRIDRELHETGLADHIDVANGKDITSRFDERVGSIRTPIKQRILPVDLFQPDGNDRGELAFRGTLDSRSLLNRDFTWRESNRRHAGATAGKDNIQEKGTRPSQIHNPGLYSDNGLARPIVCTGKDHDDVTLCPMLALARVWLILHPAA